MPSYLNAFLQPIAPCLKKRTNDGLSIFRSSCTVKWIFCNAPEMPNVFMTHIPLNVTKPLDIFLNSLI